MIFKTDSIKELLLKLSELLSFNYDKKLKLELSERIYKSAKLIGIFKTSNSKK